MKIILTPLNRTIILVSLFIMLTGNLSLLKRLLEIYPFSFGNLPFILSLTMFFTLATTLFMLMISYGRATRWILAFFLIASSQAAYYMDQYGIVIDTVMIDNIVQTNLHEAAGLLNMNLVIRTLFLGLLPAWFVLRNTPAPQGFKAELISKIALLILLILGIGAVVAPFTAGYASFVREHKMTRMFANPIYFTYSGVQYLTQKFKSTEVVRLKQTATDAVEIGPEHKNELIILVVGETARADRFSLNGYAKETNPQLSKQDVVSMTDVSSCGTSTGESVPCMFSIMKRKHFNREEALHIENALDVLYENGVQILWRDNNSDSKGVAVRMQYEDFKSPKLNPECDEECRDIGMLSGLDRYIASKSKKDILIVLHQMGNHGPEYYRRYPKEFERFTPTCKSSDLKNCTKEEIDNAYDNAILYTDFFLSKVIDFLKKYDGRYETAMLYVSDHGESLGEHGIYLHAAPYMIAPKEQTHIPAILWMGKNFDYQIDQLKPYRDYPLSHDDLFCMLLVGFEMDSKTCETRRNVLFENRDLKSTGGK
ncbi:phosphoethanolamine transferase [Methylotenera sp.]|uniref:phosphoethanolamine transferase n=1 Tax=Methylotenera sp. TaxID=2051956 RepID=UPI00273594A4|nr:phosphoethanolamine--lipid A transferase [Methylotenera sp.]MDP3211726.1 phosphoethanolamine--lipid A transferase [Methylotenera sp.]